MNEKLNKCLNEYFELLDIYEIDEFQIDSIIIEIAEIEFKIDDDIDEFIDDHNDDIKKFIIKFIQDDLIVDELINDKKIIDYDKFIYLINKFIKSYEIFENDKNELDEMKIKFSDFLYYNSNDELIIYNYNNDRFNSINYSDIELLFEIDEIVDEIVDKSDLLY